MSFFTQHPDVTIFVTLLALGYFIGRGRERRHFASIRKREQQYARKIASYATRYPPAVNELRDCVLVTGSVVIGSDYFKQFVAGLRTLFGGRMRAYESLLDRARREAVLRMKEDAMRQGYTQIFNVKLESANIGGVHAQGMPIVEVFAYGTAIKAAQTENAA